LLTAKAEIDDRVVGLDAGADDYLTKPFAMKELLARVRSMTRRHDEYAAKPLSFGDIVLDAQTFELAASNAVRLSVKEFELMQVLVAHADEPLSVDYLLGRIWRQEPDAEEDTVWLYVSYLRGKLKWVGSHVTIQRRDDGFCLATVEERA
jgi:DNA-binding response OmpR family regulator